MRLSAYAWLFHMIIWTFAAVLLITCMKCLYEKSLQVDLELLEQGYCDYENYEE